MRINVYAEELNGRIECLKRMADNGQIYHGLRIVLKGPAELPEGKPPAVTFWAASRKDLVELLAEAIHVLRE